MSTRIEINASETGTVRVFAADLNKDQIDGFDVAAALGADTLDPEQIEFFDVADLQGLGLTGFLEEGHGIPADQLHDMKPQLEALKGVVLIVPSRALGGEETGFDAICPPAPDRHILRGSPPGQL